MAQYQGKQVEIERPRKIAGITPAKKKKTVFIYKKGIDGKTIVSPVHFGDASMSDFTQHKDKDRRASFHARHKCAEKTDKTKAGYWACKDLW